jgi:feruloyl esterase
MLLCSIHFVHRSNQAAAQALASAKLRGNLTMRKLGPTTARLAGYRRQWETMINAAAAAGEETSHLEEVKEFGSNPGSLRMFVHAPKRLPPNPALVVVLHGCTQSATSYDRGTGWSTLAEAYGFVAVFPEQTSRNNPRTCFNWFQPNDTTRGRGEALSIRQMVDHTAKAYGVDRSRVFVTGLSAGGAMTAVMLATYPDVFAGGAILAGLPYGAAANVREALDQMAQAAPRPAGEWGQRVRAASKHKGPWPRVSVWHGSADATVVPANADAVVQQWTEVHGLPAQPAREERVDGYPRQVWSGADGTVLVESYTLTGMGHGTPLAPGNTDGQAGTAGAFLLDVGISSSHRILDFWGLTPAELAIRSERPDVQPDLTVSHEEPEAPRAGPGAQPLEGTILPPLHGDRSQSAGSRRTGEERPQRSGSIDPQQVITDALTAAGLMKRR